MNKQNLKIIRETLLDGRLAAIHFVRTRWSFGYNHELTVVEDSWPMPAKADPATDSLNKNARSIPTWLATNVRLGGERGQENGWSRPFDLTARRG